MENNTITNSLNTVYKEINNPNVCLVAVSKTHSNHKILEAYKAGQRIFGENKVQELLNKKKSLPSDIQWHMIGHLQTNKVKQIASFISLIHAVDSQRLLAEIDKEAQKHKRKISCLLQVKIAQEESKFGLTPNNLFDLLTLQENYPNVLVSGLMGMASFTEDTEQIRREFLNLKQLFDKTQTQHPDLKILSMGMSSDYKIALKCGSNMVRVGSAIFGIRY